jgi:tetratricopeptide (TPR) repeat protein
MNSGDELIELEYIETLDDLSSKIKLAKKAIDSVCGKPGLERADAAPRPSLEREHSVLKKGLTLEDILDENDNDIDDPNRPLKDLLDALQDLVDALFAQKKFLAYSKSLDTVVANIRPGKDRAHLRLLESIVGLMKHTVNHHSKHPCTELRYVTLLEILMSYQPETWEPSQHINAQWKRLSCEVQKGIDPEEFRRQAYQVLVSLPWVPSSYGLYSACSYEDSEALASWNDLPVSLQSRLEQIPEPLMRSDRVHHVLHKIRGRNSFTLVISYGTEESSDTYSNTMTTFGEGIGKTTLATLLAAHPTISDNYTIFWVDLLDLRWAESTEQQQDQQQNTSKETLTVSLSYSQYLECLRRLCIQLGAKPNWPNRILRLEDSQLRKLREREHMKLAKSCISELFKALDEKVLIVVDGVSDEKDFECFQFLENQSSIVITTNSSVFIPRATYTLDMEELGTDEAIQLFASESSHDRQHMIFQTVEAKTIVKNCLYHPLIVRTTARWFKMKQVTAGLRKGMEELSLELSMLKNSTASNADAFKVLSEVMNMMLSPSRRSGGEPSKVMKLCLASVAVVFSNTTVPLDAVLSLWSQLLVKHPDAIAEVSDGLPDSELFKRVWYIAEAFMHLGIFALSEDEGVLMVKLYHQMYVQYGLSLVDELSKNVSPEETKSAWHGFFVDGYNERRKRLVSMKDAKDKCRLYALQRLVYHMIEAKLIPNVVELLRDEKWCRERLFNFGWYEGSKLHADDCQLLRKRAQASKSASTAETRKVILSCLKKLSSILSDETPNLTDGARVEKAIALHLIGFTQADNGGISEALTQYKNAMTLMTQPGHPFNAIIMHSQAVLHLLRNDYDKGFKKLKSCVKVLKELDPTGEALRTLLQQEVVQLKGDSLVAGCDYRGGEESYEEALDLMNEKYPIETGTALYRRGVLHNIMGELDQAIAAINECINIKLDIGETCSNGLCHAYSKVGDLYLEFHEKEEALKHFEHALDVAEDLEEEGDEFDRVFLNGKISYLRNDEEGCEKCFDDARGMIKNSPRVLMDQSASDLRNMGRILMERGKLKEASDVFREALELTKERPESLEKASTLFEMGHCLYDLGNTKEAITCLEESLKIRSSKMGDCEMVLDTQVATGNIFRKMEMHKEYLDVSKEVMYLTEKLYKGDEEKAASAIFGVAEAYEVLGEYDQAVAMFDECKELLKRALCNDHPDVANVLQRLGKLHSLHEDYDKAFDSYSIALRICQANFEPNHPQLSETLYSTGIVARKRGDYESARQLLQDALKIQKHLQLMNETCLSLIELGNVHRLVKEPDISIGCFERCIDILDIESGDPAIYSSVYLSMGHARFSLNEISKAIECYDNALRNRIELYGRDHAETSKASRSMGIVKYIAESYAEARIYLSDFARVMEIRKTTDNVDYIIAQLLLGQILQSESRKDEALKSWTKARAVMEQHPNVGNKVPGLKDLVQRVIESSQTRHSSNQEQKSLFSRFADMARFEEEVTSEVPVAKKIDSILRSLVFLDD